MDRIKVLVIDDEPVYSDIIEKSLDTSRYQVLKSFSASEGIASSLKNKPDVILLDRNLPDMSGTDVCRKLKQTPETKNIPVLMFTSLAAVKNRVEGLNSGADDYITKPFEPEELKARIDAAARRRDVARQEILESMRTVERYISESLSERLKSGKDQLLKSGKAAILFCDLCGFTEISSTLQPGDIRNLLNSYFGIISESVYSHCGSIDKFIGDAAMAVFASDKGNFTASAAEAAIEIHRRVPGVKDPEGKPLKVRSGIHTGEVMTDSVGTEKRSDYTVIGTAVNLASKLQQEAEPGQILISSSAAREAGITRMTRVITSGEFNKRYGIEPCEVIYET